VRMATFMATRSLTAREKISLLVYMLTPIPTQAIQYPLCHGVTAHTSFPAQLVCVFTKWAGITWRRVKGVCRAI
jgi:hypothetical protein